jgi:chemotaxis signal transduction protein
MSLRDDREKARAKKPLSEDVILFDVGVMRFAIAARDVDEIRNMDGIVACQFGLDPRIAKVKATVTRMKGTVEQAFYVVNCAAHFSVLSASPTRLLILRDHPIALLADSIDRMMQVSILHAVPQAFQGAERKWYRGLAVMDGKVIPMVEPASFLGQEELDLLAANKVQAVSA